MTENEFIVLEKIQKIVKDCTKKPELYLSVQESVSQSLKNATKDLYDLAFKKKLHKNTKSQALPELIVEGFDAEQIWQQLELENNEEFSRIGIEKLSKALTSRNGELPLRTSALANYEDEEEVESDLDTSKNEFENQDEGSGDESAKKVQKEIFKTKSKKRKKHIVDDQFFKLEELNKFLTMEDQKESGSSNKKEIDSEDEELESIDLFNDIPDDESENDEDDESRNGQSFKYADFFDSPENFDDEQNAMENDIDDVDDNDDNELEDDGSDKNNDGRVNTRDHQPLFEQSDSDSGSEHQKIQSSLEKRKERLEKRINQLEDQAISEKPWQLKGEISSKDRPVNSLLEEFVEFDQVTRPAPIMTEQTTMKLEDIIRNRIKNKAWDDVEKKLKPVETPMEYKKKLIMNQEKSKESLAQIYENEYIKQREAITGNDKEAQQEEPPEHNEIKELMHSLFIKLDALSNFHYTPKPAKPEIKIVSNVPAISMEEVAPVATSDAVLLAPEEIQSKQKGDLIGKSERTKTDMKRARRKKKLKQHARALNESKKAVDTVKKSLKNKTKKLKGRNIVNMDDVADGKAIKSSTAFFSQLQDQVSSSIKSKTNSTAKKNKNALSAVKLKL